jgi:hypothetical protein
MTNTTLPPEMRIITPNHTLRSTILEYVEAFVCAYPPVPNVDTHADDSIGTMNPAHLAAGALEQPASVLSGSGNENVTTSVEMHGEMARSRLDQIKRIFRSREEIQPTPGIMPQRRVAPYTLGEFTRLNQPGFTAVRALFSFFSPLWRRTMLTRLHACSTPNCTVHRERACSSPRLTR